MRRWIVTAAALVAAAGTTTALLWYGDPERGARDAYVLQRDVPAGGAVGLESVRLEPVRVGAGARPPLGAESGARLASAVAAHDLVRGQLLQSSDLAGTSEGADRRVLVLPVKDSPPLAPGDRVDLLLVSGAGDRTTVAPLVLGLEVRAVVAGGLVVVASSRAASGLVYAAQTSRLVAVAADRASHAGQEATVSSLEDAIAAVRP